ncbi:MAG: lysophospholipid acyltransferase family protein [Candidatus Omnitrophica bacterium]|nr:lysophospholipid acyltransferase family protein [Candidatus Omnitrophota bacterium]MDD5487569.1 lysophospholipid acyltransferase family protein [Candidatus Omnitrophota bacterium]
MGKKLFENIPFRISRGLLAMFLGIFFRVTYHGRENIPEPPYIIVANHVSLLDPPLVGTAFLGKDVDFMAKKELFDSPRWGWWAKSVSCIPVDRVGGGVSSLKEALGRLKKGRAVAIFPEGTRSEDGSLREAKRGVGFLVAKAEVPVIPVYIEGSLNALPKGGKLKPGTRMTVWVGKPVYPGELFSSTGGDRKDYDGISRYIMDRIASLAT